MLLYKYRRGEHKNMLGECEFVYSPSSAFNDPFECRPVVLSGRDAELHNQVVVDRLIFNAISEWSQSPALKATTTERKYVTEFVQAHVDDERWNLDDWSNGVRSPAVKAMVTLRQVGILSLSERRDNPLMWAHYADGHRGFVVGFDAAHPYFQDSDGMFGKPLKVRYCTSRPTLSSLEQDVENLYLTKSIDWAYEQEWRVLRRLADGLRPVREVSGLFRDLPQPHFFAFPPAAVKEVILGEGMPIGATFALTNMLRKDKRYRHVSILRAYADNTDYRMTFRRMPEM
jgi:hypothetical protein